jgi:hypothetical protein
MATCGSRSCAKQAATVAGGSAGVPLKSAVPLLRQPLIPPLPATPNATWSHSAGCSMTRRGHQPEVRNYCGYAVGMEQLAPIPPMKLDGGCGLSLGNSRLPPLAQVPQRRHFASDTVQCPPHNCGRSQAGLQSCPHPSRPCPPCWHPTSRPGAGHSRHPQVVVASVPYLEASAASLHPAHAAAPLTFARQAGSDVAVLPAGRCVIYDEG